MQILTNDEQVHHVHHTMTPRGQPSYGVCISDLIFPNGEPMIVIEWDVRPDGDYPAVTVSLDPRKLHHLPGQDPDYLYEDPIVDPRPFD